MQSNVHIIQARLICKKYQLIHHQSLLKKRGDSIGYDRFKRITGTKIHVVESNRLPVSIVTSSANIHDSTKFIDVM